MFVSVWDLFWDSSCKSIWNVSPHLVKHLSSLVRFGFCHYRLNEIHVTVYINYILLLMEQYCFSFGETRPYNSECSIIISWLTSILHTTCSSKFSNKCVEIIITKQKSFRDTQINLFRDSNLELQPIFTTFLNAALFGWFCCWNITSKCGFTIMQVLETWAITHWSSTRMLI